MNLTDVKEKLKSIFNQYIGPDQPITILEILDSQTIFHSAENDKEIQVLNIGYKSIADKYFRTFPPTADEVEYAIMEVEDTIMPARKLLPEGNTLIMTGEMVTLIASLTSVESIENKVILKRESVEQVFNRMAAIINGLPASQDILPADTYFAAYLLILREVLHHLGYPAVYIVNE